MNKGLNSMKNICCKEVQPLQGCENRDGSIRSALHAKLFIFNPFGILIRILRQAQYETLVFKKHLIIGMNM